MWRLYTNEGRTGRGAHILCYLEICQEYGIRPNKLTWFLYRLAHKIPA